MSARTVRPALLAFALLLAGAPSAGAATFCVAPRTGCDFDMGTVSSALGAAGNLAGPDRVELGAATYNESGLDYIGTDPVEIAGAGAALTTLTRGASANGAVLTISGAPATIRDLTVRVGPGSGGGSQPLGIGSSTPITISDVRIRTDAGAQSPVGMRLAADATLARLDVDLTAAGAGIGVAAAAIGGTVDLSDSTVVAPTTGIKAELGGLAVRRATVRAQGLGIGAEAGSTATIDSSLVRISSNAGTGLRAYRTTAGGPSALTARQVTVVGTPGSSSKALAASSTYASAPAASTITVRDAVLRGFDYTVYRYSSAGTASVGVDHSIAPLGPGTTYSSGAGAVTFAATVADLDPLFANAGAGDYRLAAGSPAINQDAQPLAAGESGTDLAGVARIIGGARDYGAYERTLAPVATTGAATLLGPTAVRLAGSVDPGGLAGTWRILYGPTAAYGSATAPSGFVAGAGAAAVEGSLAGLAPGTAYHYALEAQNALGAVRGADATFVTPAAGQPGGGPGGGGPGGGSAGPPAGDARISALAVRPRAFRARGRGASLGAKGAAVSYRLSRAAGVAFTVRRLSRGVRSGRRCAAARRRTPRRARRCTREVGVRGGFSHAGRAGSNRVVFTGRIAGRALARGRYVLVALPRGASARTAARASFTVR
ncbi:MAG: choice-of-anchor Q domain-containing protein [Solirubrobacteraceae bacterium]